MNADPDAVTSNAVTSNAVTSNEGAPDAVTSNAGLPDVELGALAQAEEVVGAQETALVVDFGAQYAQLIARRVREANVYSEIVPHDITAAELAARNPSAIILSGGPKSVMVEGAPLMDPEVYDLGIPILGICYGAQLIAEQLGGRVGGSGAGEYGRTLMHRIPDSGSTLLTDALPENQTVWMSHFNAVVEVPDGFVATATSDGAPVAVLEDPVRKIWGVQYHPEVAHTPHGQDVIVQFLHELGGAGRRGPWTTSSRRRSPRSVTRSAAAGSSAPVGRRGLGGRRRLVHSAIGPQLTCVFVDTGLMRKTRATRSSRPSSATRASS